MHKASQSIIENSQFPGKLHFYPSHYQAPEQKPLLKYHQDAWELAMSLPFPFKRDEAWRRTDLKKLAFDQLEQASASEIARRGKSGLQPSGALLSDFGSAEKEYPDLVGKLVGRVIPPSDGKFAAIASALGGEGAFLYIPKNIHQEETIIFEVAAGSSATAGFSHSILWLEEGATCSVVLKYQTKNLSDEEQSLHCGLLEIHLGKGAKLNVVETQEFGQKVWNITHERAQLEQDAHLEWTYGALGARFSKSFIDIDLLGSGSEAEINGFYFTGQDQKLDLDTQQNHLAPHTTSNLLFKGAAIGNSKAVWQGMIYVAPNALQTDGYQSNRNLILGDEAEINAIPGLEILADDVRCSHGATVGRLDDDELFYLQSRGIPLAEAEQLIVEGFFSAIIEKIPEQSIQDDLKTTINQKLTNSVR
ncbi:MAG: Fe-S cluster assembly protein SufD [Anaerolineaceae bacterium]